jgi:phage tail-like protein
MTTPTLGPASLSELLPAFRFEVLLSTDQPLPGVTNPICHGAFAECEGLEVSMEPKSLQPGGSHDRQVHLAGPARTGQITLRRGLTTDTGLWAWFAAAARPGHLATAQGEVTVWAADGVPQLSFLLEDCLPVRLRGPSLNARDGLVATEEVQLVCGRLTVRPPGAAGQGSAPGMAFNASGGVSLSASAGGSLSVSGSVGGSANLSGGGR